MKWLERNNVLLLILTGQLSYSIFLVKGRLIIVNRQTETGSIVITPFPGAIQTKAGSATFPFFGIEPVILDPTTGKLLEGNDVEGILAIRTPWPSIARTVFNDHARYLSTYMKVIHLINKLQSIDQIVGSPILDTTSRAMEPSEIKMATFGSRVAWMVRLLLLASCRALKTVQMSSTSLDIVYLQLKLNPLSSCTPV